MENRRAWIYRIASNLTFNTLKRRNRFAWLPWRSADSQQRAAPDIAGQVATKTAVEAALAELPSTYRAPLLLYHHYGLRVRDVAEVLDISEAAVKTWLHRARK